MSLSEDEEDYIVNRARIRELIGEVDDYYASCAPEVDALTTTRRAARPDEERILSSEEVNQAQRAGAVFVSLMRKIRSRMMNRDRVYYELGLRAAHLEEALAQGDVARAEAHYGRMLEIARSLKP